MELYHLKIYIDDLLHRAVGPVGPSKGQKPKEYNLFRNLVTSKISS